MITMLNELTILSNWPCAVLVIMVIVFLVLSRIFKKYSFLLRAFGMILWVFQMLWQLGSGSKFQEMIIIWLIDFIIFWLTTPPIKKTDNKINEKCEEEQEV